MIKYKKFLTICDIDNLKQEIEMRYRIIQYKKLQKQFLLNRIEKNNVQLLFETLEDLKVQE